jgi:hypothetical protein
MPTRPACSCAIVALACWLVLLASGDDFRRPKRNDALSVRISVRPFEAS